ncbi:MAG: hypothetical protein JRH20_26065 [Deltaproteobacteria bacterium]|nr:hypothetical protein [Deltaproteobacteria bacterium]
MGGYGEHARHGYSARFGLGEHHHVSSFGVLCHTYEDLFALHDGGGHFGVRGEDPNIEVRGRELEAESRRHQTAPEADDPQPTRHAIEGVRTRHARWREASGVDAGEQAQGEVGVEGPDGEEGAWQHREHSKHEKGQTAPAAPQRELASARADQQRGKKGGGPAHHQLGALLLGQGEVVRVASHEADNVPV